MTTNVDPYRQIVENATFGVLVHIDFKILYVNPICAKLFGFPGIHEVTNLNSLLSLIDTNDHDGLRTLHNELRTGDPMTAAQEITGRRSDGSPVFLSTHGYALDWQGQAAICQTFTLLSDQDAHHERFFENEARLHDFERSISGRFWEMGPDLKFTFVSSRGAPAGALVTDYYIGKSRDEFIAWETNETEYANHAADLSAQRSFFDYRYDRENPDGTTTSISTSGVPFYDRKGAFAGYRGFASDISAAQLLRKSHSQLIDALNRVSSAIALFDSDNRSLFLNDSYRDQLDGIGISANNATFEDLLQFHLESGEFADGSLDRDTWISDHLNSNRPAELMTEFRCVSNAWRLLHVQTTEDGSILLISTDITQQKQAEEARNVSEAYLKAFVDNSPAAVFLKDRDAKFLYVNETYREWQAVTDEDIIGTTIHSLFPPDVAEQIAEQDRLALEERKSSNVERKALFPDGVVRSVMAIRFPVIDSAGEVIGVSGFLTDTSDHYRAKEELESKRELYTSVLDNLPNAVSVIGLDGRYIIANKQLQIWRSVPEDQFMGHTSADIFDDPLSLNLSRESQEEEVRRSNKIVRREEWRKCEDGVERFLEWIKFPMTNRDGEVTSVGTIGTDLTGRKTVEQHLRTAKETAEIANRAKSEFLANMSHELRTPLNAVIGFSQLMMEQTFGPLGHKNYDDYSKDIYGAGNHLLNVIGDILDISKIEAGEIELESTDVDLGMLMASAIKMIRSRADVAGVILALKIPRDLPLFRGDELRLRQIALNLLSNAVKFTPAKGRITLSIELEPSGAVKWEVSDTGIGIPSEDIVRVLRPFEQARQGFEFSHEGTGLGLYLTKTLTELHDGTLELTSTIGKGTRVTLRFPPDRTLS